MWFWIFMLMGTLIIPVTMMLFGWLFEHKPPQDVNSNYGYCTPRSMKSKEAWLFAHQYFGKIWFRWGRILLFVSVLVMLAVLGRKIGVVGTVGGILCVVQCVAMVAPIVPTERALKRKSGE